MNERKVTVRQRERTRVCSKAKGPLLRPSQRGARAPKTVAGDRMEKRITSKSESCRDTKSDPENQRYRESKIFLLMRDQYQVFFYILGQEQTSCKVKEIIAPFSFWILVL